MKRTFLVVLLVLATTFFTAAIAYADPSTGQATRSRGPVYTLSSLGFIILRLILWKMRAADQDKRVGASDEQWGRSKETAKQHSNAPRGVIVLGFIIIIIVGVIAGRNLLSKDGGDKRDDHAAIAPLPIPAAIAPLPTAAPKQVSGAPERHVAANRGYLGVRFHDIEAELAAKIGVKEGAGVQLTRVNDQSPAAKCGLKVNDIILTIADKPVHGGDELQKIVAGLPLDQAVDVVIKRGGKSLTLRLTIERPPD